MSLSRTFNFRLDGTYVASWPVISVACLDVSCLSRRHRNTHIFFRDFQITWHLIHMHLLTLYMRGLRLGFTKVCEERHFWTKSNLCGWLNFCFPKQVLKGGQSVYLVTNLSWRSSSNLRVLVAMVQYNMSADCNEKVTRESLPCLVSEFPRVVKRVVPGPSMSRQRIVKIHDLVETRSTPSSWRPFGCCLPTRANHVMCLNVGSTFPNHEGDLEVRCRRGFVFSFMRLIDNSFNLDLHHIC